MDHSGQGDVAQRQDAKWHAKRGSETIASLQTLMPSMVLLSTSVAGTSRTNSTSHLPNPPSRYIGVLTSLKTSTCQTTPSRGDAAGALPRECPRSSPDRLKDMATAWHDRMDKLPTRLRTLCRSAPPDGPGSDKPRKLSNGAEGNDCPQYVPSSPLVFGGPTHSTLDLVAPRPRRFMLTPQTGILYW